MSVAKELFMDYGYRSVSTRQVAQECGITQPALYYHFSDKQDLYVAIITEMLQQMKQDILQLVQNREKTVEERLSAVAEHLLRTTPYDMSPMLHDIRHELAEEQRERLNNGFFDSMVLPLAGLIAVGQEQGLVKNLESNRLNPVSATYIFLSLISNFNQHTGQNLPEKSRLSTSAYGQIIAGLFLRGVGGS